MTRLTRPAMTARPIFRASDLREAILAAIKAGAQVIVSGEEVRFLPATPQQPTDPFDMVEMKK